MPPLPLARLEIARLHELPLYSAAALADVGRVEIDNRLRRELAPDIDAVRIGKRPDHIPVLDIHPLRRNTVARRSEAQDVPGKKTRHARLDRRNRAASRWRHAGRTTLLKPSRAAADSAAAVAVTRRGARAAADFCQVLGARGRAFCGGICNRDLVIRRRRHRLQALLPRTLLGTACEVLRIEPLDGFAARSLRHGLFGASVRLYEVHCLLHHRDGRLDDHVRLPDDLRLRDLLGVESLLGAHPGLDCLAVGLHADGFRDVCDLLRGLVPHPVFDRGLRRADVLVGLGDRPLDLSREFVGVDETHGRGVPRHELVLLPVFAGELRKLRGVVLENVPENVNALANARLRLRRALQLLDLLFVDAFAADGFDALERRLALCDPLLEVGDAALRVLGRARVRLGTALLAVRLRTLFVESLLFFACLALEPFRLGGQLLRATVGLLGLRLAGLFATLLLRASRCIARARGLVAALLGLRKLLFGVLALGLGFLKPLALLLERLLVVREILGAITVLAHALPDVRRLRLGLVLHRRRLNLGVANLFGGL